MKQSLHIKLGQQLTMTPQLQQAIRLLQLSTIELQSEIQQALEENPMLELDDEHRESENEQTDNEEKSSSEKKELDESSDDPHIDMENNQDLPEDLAVDSDWEDIYEALPTTSKNNDAGNTSDYLIDNQGSAGESLSDHLLWQIQNSPISETDLIIAISIIDSINDDGYLTETAEEIHESLRQDTEIELDEVEAVLHMIQHLDPIGVGARDLGECLKIQLAQFSDESDTVNNAKLIVEEHLKLLGAHDYARLQRVTKLSESQLQDVINLIQSLNPKPGSVISDNATQYVIPDIFVRKINNTWHVSLNSDALPKIRINQMYEGFVKGSDRSKDMNFMKNSLQEARWFLKSLQSRSDTLLRVGNAIVNRQRLFLDYGEEGMKPMVLRDIAEELEMHESTISRVTTNKYMHTPRGVYELKYFFSSHVSTQSGGECSATAIRSMVKKLIENENPKKPLSDNKITAYLVKEGINVARRTVAKYRESMSIPPSNERKRIT